MGLMYLFPTDKNDPDHVVTNEESITLRSFGLPYIFWIYAIVIFGTLFLLFVSIKGPLDKFLEIGSGLDLILGYGLWGLFILCPLTLLSFFFYEKNITASKGCIKITHKLFFIKLKERSYPITKEQRLTAQHFIDSPNMARIKDEKTLRGFQNKGYFELLITDLNGKKIAFIDRASRKSDLNKIQEILTSYLE